MSLAAMELMGSLGLPTLPRYALVENTIITNVIVADEFFIAANLPEAIECPDVYGVGDKYEDGTFIKLDVPEPKDDAETL